MKRGIATSCIYKWMLCFYCVLLVLRELLQSIGVPIFVCLALLFAIPFVLLLWDFARRLKFSLNTFFFLLLISFYIFIYPINVNGLQFFLPLLCAGLAFKNVEYRFLAKTFLIAQVLCLLIRIYLVSMGLITEKEYGADWKVEDGRSVYDLGYGNTNAAGMSFFFLCCMFHSCWYEHRKWLSFCVILLVSYLAYYYTASRTSFYSSLFLLSTYFIPEKLHRYIKGWKMLWLSVPLIVVSPLLILPFSSSISFLDTFLSSRIYYMAYLLSLFKDPISFITGVFIEENNIIPIDNVFSYLLVYGGIVAIIVFGVFYASAVQHSKKIPFYILILLSIIVLSGLGESSWAVFGRLGSSFFWMLLLNKTIIQTEKK